MSEPFHVPFESAGECITVEGQPERLQEICQALDQTGSPCSLPLGLSVTFGISDGSILSREARIESSELEEDLLLGTCVEKQNEEELESGGSVPYPSMYANAQPMELFTSQLIPSPQSSYPEFDLRSRLSRSRVQDALQCTHEYREQEDLLPHTLACQPLFTAEEGEKILKRFGLEKEDTVHLMKFPPDQLSHANLPNIMRQIREEKEQRNMAPCESNVISDLSEEGSGEGIRSPAHEGMMKEGSGPSLHPHESEHLTTHGQSVNEPMETQHPKQPDQKQEAPKGHLQDNKQCPEGTKQQQPTRTQSSLDLTQMPTLPVAANSHCDTTKDDPQLPPRVLMEDYLSSFPRVFPYNCSLCVRECDSLLDWVAHQQSIGHIAHGKTLRQKYPAWDGRLHLHRDATQVAKTQDSGPRPIKRGRSFSPLKSGSRSRSSSSNSSRSCSSSRSSTSSTSSTSSSSDSSGADRRRRSTPDRRRDRRPSLARGGGRRHPPSGSRYRRWTPRRSREKPTSRSEEGSLRTESARRQSPNQQRRCEGQKKRSVESINTCDRRSSPHGNERVEGLLKKLIEKSARHLISSESILDDVVKTLTPILAEMIKIKSPSNLKIMSCTSTSTKPKDKPPSAEVTLREVGKHHSYDDLMSAMQRLGKVKSLVLHRQRDEAVVCFDTVDVSKLQDEKLIQTLRIPFTIKDIVSDKTVTATEVSESDIKPDKSPTATPS